MSSSTDKTQLESLIKIAKEKQNKLTAGTNITISSDNVISASGSGGGGGDGITSVTASGTSPLTLTSTTKDGAVTIGGSVDLSDYATSSDIASKQDKLTAGDNITISGSTISATNTTYSNATSSSAGLMSSSDKSNLDTLNSNAVTTVSASGTSPLTLSASKNGNTVTVSGSVANATASTAGVVKPYTVLSSAPSVNSATTTSGRYYGVSTNSNNALVVNVPWTDTASSLSDLGGVGTVNASGTSPLTLSASKSGTSVSITGSVDLSNYATTSSVPTKTSDLTNDSGFITSSALSGYATTSDLSGYQTKLKHYEDLEDGGMITSDIGGIIGTDSISTFIENYNANISINTGNGHTANYNGSEIATVSDLESKQDKLTAGNNITISGTTISATDTTYSNATTSSAGLMSASDKSTLDSLSSNAIRTVSASGTSPLTLSASKSGTSVSITGDVDLSDYQKTLKYYSEANESASIDAPQQIGISAGTGVTIIGTDDDVAIESNNDLTVNVFNAWVDVEDCFYYNGNEVATVKDVNTKQDKLTAGDNISISGSTISADVPVTKYYELWIDAYDMTFYEPNPIITSSTYSFIPSTVNYHIYKYDDNGKTEADSEVTTKGSIAYDSNGNSLGSSTILRSGSRFTEPTVYVSSGVPAYVEFSVTLSSGLELTKRVYCRQIYDNSIIVTANQLDYYIDDLLTSLRNAYPSETLIENISNWVTIESGLYGPTTAKIMDADETTQTCRVRFSYVLESQVAATTPSRLTLNDSEMPMSRVRYTESSSSGAMATNFQGYTFDILVFHLNGELLPLRTKYVLTS